MHVLLVYHNTSVEGTLWDQPFVTCREAVFFSDVVNVSHNTLLGILEVSFVEWLSFLGGYPGGSTVLSTQV